VKKGEKRRKEGSGEDKPTHQHLTNEDDKKNECHTIPTQKEE
jgi:hypothetical protein